MYFTLLLYPACHIFVLYVVLLSLLSSFSCISLFFFALFNSFQYYPEIFSLFIRMSNFKFSSVTFLIHTFFAPLKTMSICNLDSPKFLESKYIRVIGLRSFYQNKLKNTESFIQSVNIFMLPCQKVTSIVTSIVSCPVR